MVKNEDLLHRNATFGRGILRQFAGRTRSEFFSVWKMCLRTLPHFEYEQLRSFDLKDKTLRGIGTGRIGLRVMHIALAFGMKVLACDPHNKSLMAEILGVQSVPVEERLRNSHVIALHTLLTADTHHMLNREAMARFRPGVLIINTASWRCGLVCFDGLVG
jgi:lactate dehydrogenase-like 2-hydroxyacid dehydrogenase